MSRRPATDGFSDAVRAELADFQSTTHGRNITAADTVDLIKRLSALVGYTGVHGALDRALERGGTAALDWLQNKVKGKVPL